MSVAGFKKQFYKASQLVSEKVGGAEGTKLDEEFKDLERKADVTSKAVVELMNKTSEYLQPNPVTRANLSMLNTVSKIRGQVNSPGYAQPEGLLGESMTKYGKEMGENTNFGGALVEVGRSMMSLAEIKDALDIDVKQNFIDPLQAFADKDIKDLQHHLKKLESRRLDYDYKKKRQGKIPDEDVRVSLEKFHESIDLASSSMNHMLESDVEHVTQLSCLVDHLLQYHRESATILEDLSGRLKVRINEANSRPRQQYVPKARPSFDQGVADHSNGAYSSNPTSPPAYSSGPPGQPTGPSFQRASVKNRQQPSCQALYDFEPENEGELGFKEGDIITLTSQIDENWMEGTLRGQTGFFPISFVDITVPLPN